MELHYIETEPKHISMSVLHEHTRRIRHMTWTGSCFEQVHYIYNRLFTTLQHSSAASTVRWSRARGAAR